MCTNVIGVFRCELWNKLDALGHFLNIQRSCGCNRVLKLRSLFSSSLFLKFGLNNMAKVIFVIVQNVIVLPYKQLMVAVYRVVQ